MVGVKPASSLVNLTIVVQDINDAPYIFVYSDNKYSLLGVDPTEPIMCYATDVNHTSIWMKWIFVDVIYKQTAVFIDIDEAYLFVKDSADGLSSVLTLNIAIMKNPCYHGTCASTLEAMCMLQSELDQW